MFYAGGEEEDADFNITSTGGSKLANLFSFDQTPKEQSLTYTAPKQPKKTEATSGSQSAVLHAVAVHAYKLIEQQYTSQGKVGAAILGSHEASSYQLLLYKGKQQQVCITSITNTFVYTVLSNKYATFYDDRKENWSILFESDQNSIDFAKQVGLAKANSSTNGITTVITQDLTVGDGTPLENGDSAEIKYTGWILSNYTFGKLFDSNSSSEKLMRLKLGKAKVIKGWEDGLIGAKRNTQRLIIIPPSLGYGAETVSDKIPANSTLIFEVLISKIKLSKDSSRSSTPSKLSTSSTIITHESEFSDTKLAENTDSHRHQMQSTNASTDDSVRARGASISEQLSQSPKSGKAKIISRMAKMGMPMLPMQGAIVAQPSSESENEDEQSKKRSLTASPARESSPKPIIKPRPIMANPINHFISENPHAGLQSQPIAHNPIVSHQQQMAVFQPQYPGYGYPLSSMQPMSMFPQAPMAPAAPSLNDAHLPILISETRTQNSEVRMALGKISDKIENVLSKLDQNKSLQNTNSVSQSGIPYIDASALQQNIERIVQENMKWKSDIDAKNFKITALNEKICELLERNQKLVEEGNVLMEKRSDTFQSSAAQSQSRVTSLEQDKVRLASDLSVAFSNIADLKLQLQKSETNASSSSVDYTRFKENLNVLQNQLSEKETIIDDLENELKKAKDQIRTLSETVNQCKGEFSDLENTNILLKKNSEINLKSFENDISGARNEMEKLKITHKKELEQLQIQLSDLSSIVSKPDDSNNREMDISAEMKQYKENSELLEKKNKYLEERLKQLEKINASSNPPIETKLKRAMTVLYRSLQKELEPTGEYKGKDVLQITLESIRAVTEAILESEAEQKLKASDNTSENSKESKPPIQKSENKTVVRTEPTVENKDHSRIIDSEIHSQNKELVKTSSNSDNLESIVESEDETNIQKNVVNEYIPVSTQNESDNINGAASNDASKNENGPNVNTMSLPITDKKIETSSPKDDNTWRPQPPPPPLFDDDDDEDDDDWLK